MRDVIWRGYSKFDKMWHYGNLVQEEDVCYIQKLENSFQVEPKSLGQFTGLYSSFTDDYSPDGEIYEGDLVKLCKPTFPNFYKVVWCQHVGAFGLVDFTNRILGYRFFNSLLNQDGELPVYILGNAYEWEISSNETNNL